MFYNYNYAFLTFFFVFFSHISRTTLWRNWRLKSQKDAEYPEAFCLFVPPLLHLLDWVQRAEVCCGCKFTRFVSPPHMVENDSNRFDIWTFYCTHSAVLVTPAHRRHIHLVFTILPTTFASCCHEALFALYCCWLHCVFPGSLHF